MNRTTSSVKLSATFKTMFSNSLSVVLILGCWLATSSVFASGWISQPVNEVSVRHGNGCVALANGEFVKINLETAAGQAEFQLALTAKMAEKELRVFQTGTDLESGCNTGKNIKPHVMMGIKH